MSPALRHCFLFGRWGL